MARLTGRLACTLCIGELENASQSMYLQSSPYRYTTDDGVRQSGVSDESPAFFKKVKTKPG